MKLTTTLGLALSWMLAVQPAWSHEAPLTYDRIDIAAHASEDVNNDILIAVLYAQREGSNAARLADEVNRLIKDGVTRAKRVQGVKVQTLNYHTSPVYRKHTLSGWRVRQSLRLESRDAAALSGLIGELQEGLSVQSIGYDISKERRESAEDELITQAMAAFKRRAMLVTEQVGRSEYRIVHLRVNSGGTHVPPRPMRMKAMMAEAAVAPPTLEAGTQTVRVEVNGTIELVVK